MVVKNTFVSKNKKERDKKRNVIHQKCIALINAKAAR